jgi:protein TonB
MRSRLAFAWLMLAALLAAPVSADTPLGDRPIREDALPPSPTLSERVAEIRRRVREAVVYPERARRRGVTGVAHVRFQIGRDGRARAVETVRSSGDALLDRAAEQGARDARELPYVYGRVEVPIRFALESARR